MSWWSVALLVLFVANIHLQLKWPMARWLRVLSLAVLGVGTWLTISIARLQPPPVGQLLLIGVTLSFAFFARRLSPRR